MKSNLSPQKEDIREKNTLGVQLSSTFGLNVYENLNPADLELSPCKDFCTKYPPVVKFPPGRIFVGSILSGSNWALLVKLYKKIYNPGNQELYSPVRIFVGNAL